MKLTVNQALALIRAEATKSEGPIKNRVIRLIGNLVIMASKLGIGENEIVSLPEPPPPSGRRSKQQSAHKAERRSASSTTSNGSKDRANHIRSNLSQGP